MKQQNLMNWVLLVGLLWICPVYLSGGNGNLRQKNPMEKNKKCFTNQTKWIVVLDNFNGAITLSKHLNHAGDACIVFLQKNNTRDTDFGEWWLRVEKNGNSYQLWMTKEHIRKDKRMYVLNGNNCSTALPAMTECVFSPSVSGTCQIRCVQTNTVCKQSPYKESYCKDYGASLAKYRINLTETSSNCLNCDNPVKKPKSTILSVPFKTFGGRLDAGQIVGLVGGVADIAANTTESSALISLEGNNNGIIDIKPEPEDVDEVSFANVSPIDEMNILEDRERLSAYSRSVTIPKEAFEQAVSLNVTRPFVAVFRFFNFSLDEFNSTVLGEEVVAIEMGVPIANLTDTVEISLRHVEYKGIPSCHSWNGEGSQPKWISNGCDTIISGNNITCQCTHLTFFAVLLAPLNETLPSSDLKRLTIITQVGCGVSTLFVSVALFMHFFLRRTMASKATIILIHLMSAMVLLNLTFLTNNYMAQLKNSVACKIMGASMHYFMLATFTWFAAQAFHLCLQLYTGGNIPIRNYLLKVSIVSWAVPSIVVIVLFSTGKYGEQVIHTDDTGETVTMCWITDSDVHYIVNIGYYALVFLFTFSTFITIVTWLFQLKRVKGPNVPLSQNSRNIVTVLGLCCILGITWGFAFFAYGVLQIPAFYIFTILNSSQGLFLFIYYYNNSHPEVINEGVSNLNSTGSTIALKNSFNSEGNPYDNVPGQKMNTE